MDKVFQNFYERTKIIFWVKHELNTPLYRHFQEDSSYFKKPNYILTTRATLTFDLSHEYAVGSTPWKRCARVSFLIKLYAWGLQLYHIKKRLWHSCFLVKIVKFLRTPLVSASESAGEGLMISKCKKIWLD